MNEQHLTRALWKHKYLVAFSVAATIAVALLATALQDKVYGATAILQVSSPNLEPTQSAELANQGLARNYAAVLVSDSFLQRIRGRVADGTLSVDELSARLDAAPIEETALIRLEARGSGRRAAERLAEDVAEAFLTGLQRDATRRVTRQQREIERLSDRLTEQMETLDPTNPDQRARLEQLRASRDALSAQAATLTGNGVAQGASASLSARPSASADPVRPRPALNLAAGLVLGLLLGAGLAALIERLSPRLHSSREAADLLGVPILASVPLRKRLVPNDPVLEEAYEVLKATLVFQLHGRDRRVLAFVSQGPSVGKTSTVEGLAYAAVRGSESVLLIDGDLRTGTLSERLGHGDSRGLSHAIATGADLGEVLVELGPGLSLVPAQSQVRTAPGLLYGDRMRGLLAEARSRFDLVLIDCPPVAQLADGLILASLSDAIAIVARADVTKRQELETAMETVSQTGTPVVGVVVFETRPIDKTYYPATIERPPLFQSRARS